jgi:DNA polymerase (family 10)
MKSNKEIVSALKLLGQLMELHDGNSFKIKSINNASFKLGKFAELLAEKSEDDLAKIEGVGKSVAGKIIEFITTDAIQELEELKAITPPGLLDMLSIKGLGPKKIQIIWQQLSIDTIGELYYACIENRLIEAKGFGYKTQEEVKKLIEFNLMNKGSLLLSNALTLLEELNIGTGNSLFASGQLARNCEIITELTFTARKSSQDEVCKYISTIESFSGNLEGDAWKGLYNNASSLCIDFISDENWIIDNFIKSATPEHLALLDEFDEPVLRLKNISSEEEIYASINMQFIPTPMREGLREVEQAKAHKIPTLIRDEDLKGSLHNHSTWSDGIHTLEEMAVYCHQLGYTYLGICDHSQSAFYANGLKVDRVLAQHAEIEMLNAKYPDFHIFKGIESDILNDGSLDYESDILSKFDFIVASVHSNLKMDEEKANHRLLKAIENSYTTMLGHPTGRLLLARQGYPINHKLIIDACAANNVSIEINANPLRLDLDWRWVDYALSKGVYLSINPDAHKKEGYHDMKYGVLVGQKGGLSKEFCLNAWTKEELSTYFKKK